MEVSRTPYDNAREYLAPALGTAKESGTHALQAAMAAMVPVVAMAAPAVAAAKHKGSDLLHSDAAQEARERAALMVLAAKGETLAKKRRRWPLLFAFFAIGGAVGAAITNWLQRTADFGPSTYVEDGHAGPNVDLTHPLTENEPQPVNVLDEDTEAASDYSDPKATF
ncbi:MAG: hypothetical protein ABIM89_08130 [Mycobacteriales bacterium]